MYLNTGGVRLNNTLYDLVEYLNKQPSHIPGKELAIYFKVSTRTIQNYVKEINHIAKKEVITSNRNGYLLNKSNAIDILNSNYVTIPQDNTSRAIYVLKKILANPNKDANSFDLCDELFISYSTFRNLITYINNYLRKFNLKVNSKNNSISIEGNEENLRKLMKTIIYEEVSNHNFSIEYLPAYFSLSFVKKIEAFLEVFSLENDISLNEISKFNLVLDFCILVDRVEKGSYCLDSSSDDSLPELDKYLMENLQQSLIQHCNVNLNNCDLKEAYLIIQINSNLKINQEDHCLKKEVVDLTDNIILLIKDTYQVDLNSDSFKIPFILHLNRLIIRINSDKETINPLLEQVKKTIPVVYDIAVFASFHINNVFNRKVIGEDEIAFIALHIGVEINKQKTESEKISVILVVPEYLGIEKNLSKEILCSFQDNLNIIYGEQFMPQSDISTPKVELVITTFSLSYFQKKDYPHIVSISPFFNSEDQFKIFEAINYVKKQRLERLLVEQFDYFFDKSLFHIDSGTFENKYDVIELLASNLVENEYVDNDFIKHVINREQLSSTAYGKIAVPHQFIIESMKTGVNVLVSKEGILWQNNLVNVVLLISINREDKKDFSYLYEALLNLFAEEKAIELIKTSNTFEEFKNNILTIISHQ